MKNNAYWLGKQILLSGMEVTMKFTFTSKSGDVVIAQDAPIDGEATYLVHVHSSSDNPQYLTESELTEVLEAWAAHHHWEIKKK